MRALAGTPWRSGAVMHEQGLSKAGNPQLRTTMVQLAWLWLRHQAAIGTGEMVPCARRARPQGLHRRAGAQAARRLVEVRHTWRPHRGSCDEARSLAQLSPPQPSCHQQRTTNRTNLPRPDQSRPIRVDEPMDCLASNAATKNGPILSSPARRKRILVQSPRATTECEFDLAAKPDRRNRLETLDRKNKETGLLTHIIPM